MSDYRPVPPQVDLPTLEHEVLALWRDQKTFEKSLDRATDRPRWTFYEGPPTANGRPGTHHVEARVFKDVFPRFKTMQGHLVERKAGWDCHGLPVELAVEKELGFSGKKDIEAYGVAEFNARCRESVLRHVDAFEEMTERMGYWVDTSDPYRTMDPGYVESVWWALKQIHAKGLLVEDYRVAPYCPRCGTGLSDHELAQGYETVTDPSVYVRFPLTSGPYAGRASLLVWTTTPWTLVSNTAVAAKPDVTYVVATDGTESLVVAEPLFEQVLGEGWTVEDTVKGQDMERWTYQRPFELVEFPPSETAPHIVVLADYVTTEDGTGLVHQSPAFGEDDMAVCKAYGLPVVVPVQPDGHFGPDVPLVGGQFFKHADTDLVKDLAARGLLFRHVAYEHSYPHCWRCHTALMYYAQPSWYVRTTAVKDALLRENEKTNWFPETIQWGRYGDWLTNNIDWALSRSRYWGTPLPIWRCGEGHQTCVGSLAELSELSGTDQSALDPHRPYVDDVVVTCPECGAEARRVPEVIDAWFDSGSMPFAQWGYPHTPGSDRDLRAGLPRRLHLRGHRPDPGLVLHADGDRHAGVRRVVVPQRAVPGPHPGRGRPQDVQAPRQHPRADAVDGRARRRRGAVVHGRVRLPVGRAPGRARQHPGDRPQGAADLLERRGVPGALRAHVGLVAGRRGAAAGGATGPGPVGAVRGAPAGDRGHRGARGLRHPAGRVAARGVRRRPVELVRPPLAAPLLGR